jgi:hypothetical protein
MCFAGGYIIYDLCHHYLNRPETRSSHPAYLTWPDSRLTGRFNRSNSKTLVICGLDVNLFKFTSDLELCLACIRVLEF